jgi:hypothetical protein
VRHDLAALGAIVALVAAVALFAYLISIAAL